MSVVVEDETSSCDAPGAGQKDVMTKWPLQNNAHERRVRVARDAEVRATIYYGNFRRPRAVVTRRRTRCVVVTLVHPRRQPHVATKRPQCVLENAA